MTHHDPFDSYDFKESNNEEPRAPSFISIDSFKRILLVYNKVVKIILSQLELHLWCDSVISLYDFPTYILGLTH